MVANAPADVIRSLASVKNINMYSQSGNTPLCGIIEDQFWHLVPILCLLQLWADLNLLYTLQQTSFSPPHVTPLHAAIAIRDNPAPEGVIKSLISPCNANMTCSGGNSTPLYCCIIEQMEHCVSIDRAYSRYQLLRTPLKSTAHCSICPRCPKRHCVPPCFTA